jgi:hypothetical protein
MSDWLRLTPEDTDLPPDVLARLSIRTQHRDADGTPIMSAQELAEVVEMDRTERGEGCA